MIELQQSRTARQDGLIDKWKASPFKCRGTVIAATGFGKTMVAIRAIQRMNLSKPDYTTFVVVPTTNLYDDWVKEDGHVNKFGLINVKVFVINTFIMEERFCEFLIIDEIHRTGAESFQKALNTKCKFILGLTGTLERLDGRHLLIQKYCPVVDEVSIQECLTNSWVSNYKIFNFGINASLEDNDDYKKLKNTIDSNFSKFEFNFPLMLACSVGDAAKAKVDFNRDGTLANKYSVDSFSVWKTGKEWRAWLASKNGWSGEEHHPFNPKAIMVYAIQTRRAISKRKELIHSHPAKVEVVKKLVDYFKDKQILLFGETADVADKMQQIIGKECDVYHSKLKSRTIPVNTSTQLPLIQLEEGKEVNVKHVKYGIKRLKPYILDRFKNKVTRVLSTVRALDEGYDVPGVEIGIQYSFNSSKTQGTQRTGRVVRKDFNNEDKVAIFINIYLKDSQEEKWLREKQKGVVAIPVNSIEQLAKFI
jgi:superfamily II DNA or RNA helicase